MKKILLMMLLAAFAMPELYSQNCNNPPNCILNPGIDPNIQVNWGVTNVTNANLPNWWVLSGTPVYNQGMVSSSGFQLNSGEGMVTCFNFRQNVGYNVCIYGYNTTTQTGDLTLQAHDGTNWLNIGTIPYIQNGIGGGPALRTVNFNTGGNNYTQLRIIASTNANYSVVVDDVGVVEIPTVSADASTINECQSTTLRVTSNNALNVTWSPAAGLNTTTGTAVIASPCQTTTYTATYSSTCNPIYGCGNFVKNVTVTVDPSTTSVTASPPAIDLCQSTTLTANGPSGVNVTWSPATGLNATTGTSVIASPCQTTTYTATFRCANGCRYNKSVTVVVNPPATSVTASPPTIDFCQSTTLTANGASGMTVTWSPSTGLNTTTGTSVIASPCQTTTYIASFRCNNNGCMHTRPVTVVVDTNGGIVDSSSTVCGDTLDLRYVPDTPCAGNTYSWVNPNGSVVSTGPSYFKYPTTMADMGIYTLTVTSANGCTTTFTKAVVMDCCNVAADFDAVDCNPIRFINTTSSTNTSGIQGEWHWDFGDGNSSSIKNPSHLYTNQLGLHTVCLTAVLFNGPSTCCAKICKEVEVCDFTCEPKAAFTYTVVDPNIGDVQFTDKSVGGGTACSWRWWVNGPGIPVSYSGQNPLINLGGPGIYNICLEVEFCCPNGTTSHFETWCEDIIVN